MRVRHIASCNMQHALTQIMRVEQFVEDALSTIVVVRSQEPLSLLRTRFVQPSHIVEVLLFGCQLES
jgi:hypothetical protein